MAGQGKNPAAPRGVTKRIKTTALARAALSNAHCWKPRSALARGPRRNGAPTTRSRPAGPPPRPCSICERPGTGRDPAHSHAGQDRREHRRAHRRPQARSAQCRNLRPLQSQHGRDEGAAEAESDLAGQRKNSIFASRNQTVLGGAADIGPLMPNTAISKVSPGLTASLSTTRLGMLKPWIVAGLGLPAVRGNSPLPLLPPAYMVDLMT